MDFHRGFLFGCELLCRSFGNVLVIALDELELQLSHLMVSATFSTPTRAASPEPVRAVLDQDRQQLTVRSGVAGADDDSAGHPLGWPGQSLVRGSIRLRTSFAVWRFTAPVMAIVEI